jgi:hypothetical protein
MKRLCKMFVVMAFSLQLLPAMQLHRNRDPLTEKEIDELREQTIEPEKRLKLYVQFTSLRLDWVEKSPPPDNLTHERLPTTPLQALEDFTALVDEIDSNVDMFHRQHNDIRKSLKLIVESETKWSEKLKSWEGNLAVLTKDSEQQQKLRLAIKDAIEAIESNLDSMKAVIAEQDEQAEERAKDKKKKK